MGVKWTREQQQVIDLREKNILVSAAAGSGKTAVLVERIISRVLDGKHPMDIDRLLVVTFTRAAAGEMRERIAAAIEKKLGEEPDNLHLQKQSALIHHARITTIDSFCAYVVRNYFHKIDLDPGFRMAEDGELKLLMQDVLAKVMEEAYQEGDGAFLSLMESYATGKSDASMESIVQQLFTFSMSTPNPFRWLKGCKNAYELQTEEELEQSAWMQQFLKDSNQMIEAAYELNQNARKLLEDWDGPHTYGEMLMDDQDFMEQLLAANCYQKRFELFAKHKYIALSRKKDPDASEEKKKLAKNLRDEYKELLKDLQEHNYNQSITQVLADMQAAAGPVGALIDLTIRFAQRFTREKRERNLMDFADLEHFALEILVEQEETPEGMVYHETEAARELAESFDEIMIDEYQDSNYVQELLLTAVSRMRDGQYNMFMVGDVKQSIYRFRLARPEIFMEKFHSYQKGQEGCQRIDLHKNFRSRKEVLDSVNFIFRQIMQKELGNVEYDEDALLHCGAQFPEGSKSDHTTEILLMEMDDPKWEELDSDENGIELEARMIAGKIQDMVGVERVLDKAAGEYRLMEYRDCVILLRTVSKWAETMGQMLGSLHIPVNITSRSGYFSALEVVTILNYLHICDNPLQDIPFVGVLYSPIGGCDARELAQIKAACKEGYLCQAARAYIEIEDGEKPLQEKLQQFFAVYDAIRKRASYVPIHQLLWEILRETGYQEYVRALPGGEQRYANLQMLLQKAKEFENTSYRGLFHFIRYIENLQKYQYELGEASTTSENENAVRIMSIHKSKGLEFPVVFVAGMGKKFNLQDSRAKLLPHMDYGVGADVVDYHLRLKSPTLFKKIIQRQLVWDSLGEELRVLYVALTRAKEKLIMTGTVEKLETRIQEYHMFRDQDKEALAFFYLAGATSYMDWILPALSRHRSMNLLYERFGLSNASLNPLYMSEAEFSISCISPWDLTEEEVDRQSEKLLRKEIFQAWQNADGVDSDDAYDWQERFSYQYPYENRREIPMKVSVSDLKAGKFKEEDEEVLYEEVLVPYIPGFMSQEEEVLHGAFRGTAYHRVMECLDYTRIASVEDIKEQLETLVKEGKMTEEMAACILPEDIFTFVMSPLGQRMQKAHMQKALYREKQFFLEVPASRLRENWPDEEGVLVQGIIDAFFVEDGELVLVDYKTDKVYNPKELIEKYRIQLESYAEALEKLMGMKVKEKQIYSFTIGRSLDV